MDTFSAVEDVIITYDTASTIAWILGLKEPQPWRGKPVLSAFEYRTDQAQFVMWYSS